MTARGEIRSHLERLTGPLRRPPQPARYEITSRARSGGIERLALRYAVDDPAEVPAIALLPDVPDPRRTCLALHQTTVPMEVGAKEVVGEAGDPAFRYGLELARRGFSVICPDYPHFGDYGLDTDAVYERFGYKSMSMKGVANHIAAIDVLEDLISAPASHLVAIGHSLGGTNAILLGILEPRVGQVVTSCGFSDFASYARTAPTRDLTGWARREKYMPLIRNFYNADPAQVPIDFDDILSLLKPKPLFISAAKRDEVFDFAGAERVVEMVKACYAAPGEGGPAPIEVATPDTAHTFPEEVRRQAYGFIERHLPAA